MDLGNLKIRASSDGSIRKAIRNESRFMFEHEFENDVSISEDMFLCDGVTPKKPVLIRLFDEKYTSVGGFVKSYAVKIADALKIGELLYDCEENTYWICKSCYKKGGIYCTGALLRCIEMPLKWQDDNGNIFEYPVFDYTGFNADVTDYKIVNVGEGKHKLTTIADKNTVKLKHDKRFFWDRDTENPTVFKITQNDCTTLFYDKGLITLTITEDQYNKDTDSIEQWICNFKETDNSNLSLQYNGDNSIRIGRSRRVWIDTEDKVVWNCLAENGVVFEENGASVKIICPLDENLIGTKIRVKAEVNGNISECEFDIVGGV